MNGTTDEIVASSWIDALGGVSMCWILRTPPCFWADAPLAATANATTPAKAKHSFFIVSSLTTRCWTHSSRTRSNGGSAGLYWLDRPVCTPHRGIDERNCQPIRLDTVAAPAEQGCLVRGRGLRRDG